MVIKEIASEGIHQKCFELIMKEPKGKLLDLGSGEGAFVQRTLSKFDTTAADINKKRFKVEGIRFLEIDLNKECNLSEEFDYISCIEVIEHLENPHKLIRDCNKLLKKEGVLIITTPNIDNTFSKLLFLFAGYFNWFARMDIKYEHISPISYLEMKTILETNGFIIEEIATNKKIPYFSFKRKLMANGVGLLTFFVNPFNRHKVNLLKRGEIMIIKARKKQ